MSTFYEHLGTADQRLPEECKARSADVTWWTASPVTWIAYQSLSQVSKQHSNTTAIKNWPGSRSTS